MTTKAAKKMQKEVKVLEKNNGQRSNVNEINFTNFFLGVCLQCAH